MISPTNHAVAAIKKAVATDFGVTVAQIDSRSRTANLASARQVAMQITRTLLGLSYPAISAHFNRGDHMTSLHAAHVVAERCSTDKLFAARVAGLSAKLSTALRKVA